MRGGRCSLGYAPFAEMVPITVILNSVTVFARMKMEAHNLRPPGSVSRRIMY